MGECITSAGTALHAGHVNVAGIERPTPSRTVSAIRDAEGVATALAKEVPGVTQAVSRGVSWVRLIGEGGSLEVQIWGVDASQEHRLFEVLAPAGAPGTTRGATNTADAAVVAIAEAFRDIYLSGVLRFSVQPMLLVQATLGIATVSSVACIWLALRAARLRPIAAFRVEN